jgi:hypothetical protein
MPCLSFVTSQDLTSTRTEIIVYRRWQLRLTAGRSSDAGAVQQGIAGCWSSLFCSCAYSLTAVCEGMYLIPLMRRMSLCWDVASRFPPNRPVGRPSVRRRVYIHTGRPEPSRPMVGVVVSTPLLKCRAIVRPVRTTCGAICRTVFTVCQ